MKRFSPINNQGIANFLGTGILGRAVGAKNNVPNGGSNTVVHFGINEVVVKMVSTQIPAVGANTFVIVKTPMYPLVSEIHGKKADQPRGSKVKTHDEPSERGKLSLKPRPTMSIFFFKEAK